MQHSDVDLARTSSDRGSDRVFALRCRACGKLHRVRELPRDPSGRLALFFRFTCLRCGHCDVACLHDMTAHRRIEPHPPRKTSSA